ncbi:hypothetical protein ACQEU5_00255 [Marinactinospora thermotolerans]|uniref:hypothetical protein n=1 Tax=Marinactinospora thermotolerans TaxID=531310 RepID=UPI003D8E755A
MASQRSRRVNLPGAAELFFQPTSVEPGPGTQPPAEAPPAVPEPAPAGDARAETPAKRSRKPRAQRARAPQPSGRQRHDEKITVYISRPELLALEQTRLTLRANYGITADRGRIVREAVAVLLADFEEHGETSRLVQRLTDD